MLVPKVLVHSCGDRECLSSCTSNQASFGCVSDVRNKWHEAVVLIPQEIRNRAPELRCLFEGLEDNV